MRNHDHASPTFDALARPAIRDVVEVFAGGARGLCGEIDRRDEMLLYNLDLLYGNETCAAALYFLKGWQIACAVRDVAEHAFGGLERVGSLLDFAAGFGRATRFVVREIAPERVWIADVVAEAVAFQQVRLGVNTVLSHADPAALAIDRRFDLVFVASLFSHLPETTFGRWLGKLTGLLAPGGLLAFSVLGAPETAAEGLVFHAESESRVLPGEQYGTAHVSERYVRERVGEVAGGAAVVRVAAGLCGHQDLYLVDPWPERRARPLAAVALRRFPRGDLDHLETRGEHGVEIGGWAGDTDPDGAIVEVAVWSQGRRQPAELAADGADAGRVRWRARLDRGQIGLDAMVLILARTRAGVEGVIALGTLRPFLTAEPRPADLKSSLKG